MFSSTIKITKLAALVVGLPVSATWAASLPAVVLINNPGSGASGSASVRGWGFTALDSFDIVALGLADVENNLPPQFQLPGDTGGFATPHSVNLWSSSGNQLASVTVQSGTASPVGPGTIGGSGSVFRYEDLAAPVTVNVGESYVISAFYQQLSGDRAASDPFQGSLVFDDRIQTTGLRFGATASHLFPTTVDGRFRFSAASFLIGETSSQPVPPVPLPAGLPLLLGGLTVLGVARRVCATQGSGRQSRR